jgi:hypothetical protein
MGIPFLADMLFVGVLGKATAHYRNYTIPVGGKTTEMCK